MWLWAAELAWGAPTHSAIEAASWEVLAHADNGSAGRVDLYNAKIGGIDCFRGVATTEVSVDALLAVVLDLDTAARWSTTGVTESRLLQARGTTIVYHQYLDVPGWTLSADRYWFLQAEVSRSPGRGVIAWDRLPAGSPVLAERDAFAAAHPGAIEPPTNVGSWRFEAGPSATRIVYSLCTQSGGAIPAALQNAATRRTLPDNIGDLIREARRR